MKKPILIVFSLLLSVLVSPARSETCAEHCRMAGMKSGSGCPMMESDGSDGDFFVDDAKELGLSDDQIVKLVKLRNSSEERLSVAQHKVYEAEAAIGKLMHEKKVDRKKVEEKARELGKWKGEVEWARMSAMMDAYGVLNDPQKAKLNAGAGDETCPYMKDGR